MKSIDDIRDYVLLTLGAPVLRVDLSEGELCYCVEQPLRMLEDSKIVSKLSPLKLDQLLMDGASALGRYIVAKKKFQRSGFGSIMSPDDDGFADMTAADSDWCEFVGNVKHYRISLRSNVNGDDTGSDS